MPDRIRLSRAKGWRLPDGAVHVARPTRWGNPFVVGRDGTAADCVMLYGLLVKHRMVCLTCKATDEDQIAARRHVLRNLGQLRGRDLACWCRLDQPCHADVLLELANAPLRCEATDG
jgi:hypothetical protein